MVTHVLSDNFNLLMDPSQQVTVPIERRPNPNFGLSDHPFYRRMGVPSAVFNHHDVVGDASDRKYLRDVVEQFRSMPRNVKKLFVLVTVWPADISVYRSIQKALEQYGDHSLLILDVLGPGESNLQKVVDEEAFELFRYVPHTDLIGIHFGDDRDFQMLREIVMTRIPEGTPLHDPSVEDDTPYLPVTASPAPNQ